MVMQRDFAIGHGTGNDFVILPDDTWDPTPSTVRALCDRRTGIGGDGILRVVRLDGEWFMDYRNADGSLAEMCGNGARVFARYLLESGLEERTSGEFLTRAGQVAYRVLPDGAIAVTMSAPVIGTHVIVRVGDREWAGDAVFAPNPHAVVEVSDLADAGDLLGAPGIPPDVFPEGANIEFVRVDAPGRVSMRVFERGVGETMSCGTGAVAVAAAHAAEYGIALCDGVLVEVPGGLLTVRALGAESVALEGPAVLVAHGQLAADWIDANP